MPYFERPDVRIHYVDQGEGPAIIATHGVAESHLYWTLPGIADALASAGFRVICADMRGHGRTQVQGALKGYDVETVAADFGALADFLGIERFFLLSHATGGMAALRYAMNSSDRLLGLMCTNTGSATIPTDSAADETDPRADFHAFARQAPPSLAPVFRGRPWVQILAGARAGADRDPFLNRMTVAADPAAAFAWYERCARLSDPDTLADFMENFYTDPDPRIAQLRAIKCPCLALTGEYDVMFRKPTAQLAREIFGARHVVMQGRGHMIAFEDPEGLKRELLTFLSEAT